MNKLPVVCEAVIAQREKRTGFDEERREAELSWVEGREKRGAKEERENRAAVATYRGRNEDDDVWERRGRKLAFFCSRRTRRAASRMHCSSTHTLISPCEWSQVLLKYPVPCSVNLVACIPAPSCYVKTKRYGRQISGKVLSSLLGFKAPFRMP